MRRTAALVLILLMAGCSSSSRTPIARTVPSPDISASSPSPAGSPSPRPVRTVARAVYYLHDDGSGPRLYREFHPRATTTGTVRDAVTAMLTEPAYDGDYTSLWPRGTAVRGARVSGTTAFVDLSRAATRSSSGAEGEAQSLQQLAWTVTAAAPSVRTVQLLIEGRAPETLWGHVDTSRPISRGQAASVLGAVWLLLRDGTAVARGGAIHGEATVFEATVSYEWRQGGRVVKQGSTNAAVGAPGRGRWQLTANVPPGRYLLRAFESSAKDGAPRQVDDKHVVVMG